jgi:acyl-CoA hydrolase
VRVEGEDVATGAVRHVGTAYLTMVALGVDERPIEVGALEPATDSERRRRDEAGVRRKVRLAQLAALAAVPLDR